MSRHSRRGFTLLELLVVIAIITLLAAILFPVFAQARAKARQIVCVSNMKQIGLAVSMYLQDYDGRYCIARSEDPTRNPSVIQCLPSRTGSPFDPNTPFLLRPYIKNVDVLKCPNEQSSNYDGIPHQAPQYAMNELIALPGMVVPDGGEFIGPLGRLDSQVKSNMMILWEHDNASSYCNTWSTKPGHWNQAHHNGFNSLWADGHVAYWNLGKMTTAIVTYWEE